MKVVAGSAKEKNEARVDADGSRAAYIPLGYYVDFLKFLFENREIIQVLTYKDLPWGDDFAFATNYPEERKNWNRLLASGKVDPSKIYVLIQHDVDSRPERTMAQIREEMRLGIPSNVMIFNRRVDRRHLRDTNQLRLTGYRLDDALLVEARDEGFVIGYHSNAFERAHFEPEKAQKIFIDDVEALDERFGIEFFSPHGGTPSPDGLNNRDLAVPESMHRRVRWVHNGHTPVFDGYYSDGGLNSLSRDPANRDLRDFVRTWQPGRRYRVVTHPQYYSVRCSISPRLAGTPWYEEVRATYSGSSRGSAWDDVAVSDAQPAELRAVDPRFAKLARNPAVRRLRRLFRS